MAIHKNTCRIKEMISVIGQSCIIVATTIIGVGIGFLWRGFWGSLLGGITGLSCSITVISIVSENNQRQAKKIFKKKLTLMDLLVASAVAGLIATIIVPVTKPHQISPGRKTLRSISELDYFFNNYYCKNGRWPNETKWEEQLLSFTGDLETEHYFLDGWKNPIQYRITDKNGTQIVLLYSFGKNKNDDNGNGDDIVKKIKQPTAEEIENYKSNSEAAAGGDML